LEKVRNNGGIFCCSFSQAKDVLLSLVVDANGRDHMVLAEGDPINIYNGDLQGIETSSQKRGALLLAC
jgi:hypothetical protein